MCLAKVKYVLSFLTTEHLSASAIHKRLQNKYGVNMMPLNAPYCYTWTLLERGDLSRKEKKDGEGPEKSAY